MDHAKLTAICGKYRLKEKHAKLITLITSLIKPIKEQPIEAAIIFSAFIIVLTLILPGSGILAALATSFVSIFTALKYKLDQASYHKALFEERLEVFNAIHEALVSSGKKAEWYDINQKLTPVLNKSYFLFSHKTYAFIRELSEQLITKALEPRSEAERGTSSITKEQIAKANVFLNNLLSERELAKKFPELKIDAY